MSNQSYLQPVPTDSAEVVDTGLAFDSLPGSMWASPGEVGPALQQLHAALVDELRRDTRHFPSGVIGAMQLERAATYYIKIRYFEASGSWPNEKYRQHLYKMSRDAMNDLTAASVSNKMSPEILHGLINSHTAKIVQEVLSGLPSEQSKPLFRKFATALENNTA